MYISIDVGGSTCRVASFTSMEYPRIKDIDSTQHTGVYKDDLKNITSAVQGLSTEKIEGIGVSLSGLLNQDKSSLKIAPNLPSWMGQPIKADLESIFHCPVFMENDCAAAALGEAMFGYGKNKDFVLIIWATGIGGTDVKNVHDQLHISPFEPGHVPIDWDGPLCTCGQKGCLETFCGGAGIEKKYKKPAKQLSEKEWDEVIENMSQGLMNVVMMRPTKLIVLSGNVAVKQSKRLAKISRTLKERLRMFDVPELKISKFQERAGLYGALGLLKNQLFSKAI